MWDVASARRLIQATARRATELSRIMIAEGPPARRSGILHRGVLASGDRARLLSGSHLAFWGRRTRASSSLCEPLLFRVPVSATLVPPAYDRTAAPCGIILRISARPITIVARRATLAASGTLVLSGDFTVG